MSTRERGKRTLQSIVKKWKGEQRILCKLFKGKTIPDPYRKYIENSIYIVPVQTLLAYLYVDGLNLPVQDQTVWVINKYDKGYFFGKTYAAINGKPSTQLNMSGSITSSGEVYITFLSPPNSNTDTVIKGVGKFVITKDSGYFVMQMNSAENSSSGLSHWSYMVSVKPGDYWYQNLPSVGTSVPYFINSF